MATSGRDIILTLLADVDGLKQGAHETTRQLEATNEHLKLAVSHVEQLTRLAKDNAKRTDRIARTLAKLADLLEDHESRLSALESRQ
jgi:hypothetical protein